MTLTVKQMEHVEHMKKKDILSACFGKCRVNDPVCIHNINKREAIDCVACKFVSRDKDLKRRFCNGTTIEEQQAKILEIQNDN